jgi:hypothetical protein
MQERNFFTLGTLKVVCMQIHSVCWHKLESAVGEKIEKENKDFSRSPSESSYAMAHIPLCCGHNSQASRRAKLLMNSA